MSRSNFFGNLVPTWARRGETPSTPNPALERAQLEAQQERVRFTAPPVDNGHWYIDTSGFHHASLELDRSQRESREEIQERVIRNLNDEIRHYRQQYDSMQTHSRELQNALSNLKASSQAEISELNERIEYLEFVLKEENGAENE